MIDTASTLARHRRLVALTKERRTFAASDLIAIARDDQGEYPLCNTTSRFPWRTISAWVHCLKIGDASRCVSLACNTAPAPGDFTPFSAAAPEM
ncbi:MAG: hypothetical protein PHV34_19405 [Verrucomicrobiae bacterium]|nr:hypothetical protein [Verrucomicrobiae bacterium]